MSMIDDIRAMTDDQINDAVAIEVMGFVEQYASWVLGACPYWCFYNQGDLSPIYVKSSYDPAGDLNWCWDAEHKFASNNSNSKLNHLWKQYYEALMEIVRPEMMGLTNAHLIHATARQRCEAMLATVRGVK